MRLTEALKVLKAIDKFGRYVHTKNELRKFFKAENSKTFDEGLARLVSYKVLTRVCYGVYLNELSLHKDSYVIEHIAKALRRGHYNYVSLESILSEYGVISQIPIDRLTVMTTGRKGLYVTKYGVIEFTHTKRSIYEVINSMITDPRRPLRIATKESAIRDLRRVGRNLSLIQLDEI